MQLQHVDAADTDDTLVVCSEYDRVLVVSVTTKRYGSGKTV